nr:uncharacterized protein LOC117449038 isoform X2 [Pseudochaenichthys georgianus]
MGLIKGVSLSDIEMSQEDDVPDPCFKPFISKGFVSLTGDPKDQLPVQVLRDTGGSQSIIREGILPLTSRSSCGSSAVVQGVGMTLVAAPLHNVYIHSSLVKGFFKVAVLPALPSKGVDFILSNDLAGGKVKPVPEVIDSPDLSLDAEKSAEVPPEIFPACVVTRAQSNKYGEDLSDSFLATGQFLEDMTVSDRLPEEARSAGAGSPSNSSELVQPPATRQEFMAAQLSDETLSKCLSSVISHEEAKSKKMAYIMENHLLMRRWISDACEESDSLAIYQVVVPTTYRSQVMSLAHDHPWSGHMGVTKTYQRVLKHFFWPGLKSDVVLYCRTCHVCQVVGKPNQVIHPAPLIPIPVMGEPFERVIVDCVGPLPKAKTGNQFLLTVMCASTRFPEAIPLRKITAPVITKALLKFFSMFGLPKVVQTDQDKKLGETNYVIQTPDRRRPTRVCHINMLKKYCTREDQSESSKAHQVETTVSPMASVSKVSSNEDEDELVMRSATPQGARLSNTEVLVDLPNYLSHLLDIQKLIFDFACIFNDTPSQTSVLAHDVVLTNPSPIKQRAYRVNPVKREVMKREVEYLLKNGFARPSSSPWSSPCVLDTKSDGSPRFCTDFRKVNAVTVPDAHPLPLIDDCIDEIGPAQFVSKLDMLKGYWQVPLTQRASDISAFVTPYSFLQYTVMPFGMCNAPATFQRLVNLVLGHVPDCKAYLDDIVYSKDWSSHMSTLREVFKCLSAASLTLNLAKCEFGKGTVLYLGQQVGRGKVCPADAKIRAIASLPVPSTRRELRRFLGMAGYYRCFCRNFSSVAAPLTTLTSPSKSFVWSGECQQSFESLKGILCCTPVLSAPDFSKPFKLEVDASGVGTGAVLLQEDAQAIDHPVSYFSRKFNKHQLKYSTIEKEALALLFALQHFEVYLGSSVKPIKVYTDHNPLVFLSRMNNHNQRLMRWSLIVQNYNLDISHKKGSDNVLADALSRAM